LFHSLDNFITFARNKAGKHENFGFSVIWMSCGSQGDQNQGTHSITIQKVATPVCQSCFYGWIIKYCQFKTAFSSVYDFESFPMDLQGKGSTNLV